MRRSPTHSRTRTARLLDEIKDEIDRLHEIRSVRQRTEAAQDLAEYLLLHHEVRA